MPDTLKSKTNALRRAHLLDAAAAVFAERGFHQTTVRDVAREAGVADGTIYNVFANKAALLDGLLDRLADDRPPSPTALSTTADLQTLLRTLIEARWAGHTDDLDPIVRVVLAEALISPALRQAFRAKVLEPALAPLASLLSAYTGADDRDADIASRVVLATFLGAQVLRLLGDAQLAKSGDRAPAAIAAILADGLTPR